MSQGRWLYRLVMPNHHRVLKKEHHTQPCTLQALSLSEQAGTEICRKPQLQEPRIRAS